MTQGRVLKVAAAGSTNIRTDLMIEVLRHTESLEMATMGPTPLARTQRAFFPRACRPIASSIGSFFWFSPAETVKRASRRWAKSITWTFPESTRTTVS